MTHESLLARLREAKGPDQKLDAEIDALIYGGFPSHLCHDRTRRSYGPGYIHNADDGSNLTQGGRSAPPLTSSVDAILALIERKLPGWMWTLYHEYVITEQPNVAFLKHKNIDLPLEAGEHRGDAATPALALCIAFVSALSAIAASEGEK